MINLWRDLPPGPNPPEQCTAIVEIPQGSRNKYELDKTTGLMKLDRVLVDFRPIGVLKLLDRGEPDDKILGVPLHDPYYNEIFDIADIPNHQLREIQHFFLTYKDLEGKRMENLGWGQSVEAMRITMESVERYDAAYLSVGP